MALELALASTGVGAIAGSTGEKPAACTRYAFPDKRGGYAPTPRLHGAGASPACRPVRCPSRLRCMPLLAANLIFLVGRDVCGGCPVVCCTGREETRTGGAHDWPMLTGLHDSGVVRGLGGRCATLATTCSSEEVGCRRHHPVGAAQRSICSSRWEAHACQCM